MACRRASNGPGTQGDRVAREFTLTGADLAIERSAARLLRGSRSGWEGPWLPGTLYAGGGLLVLAAGLDRRRRGLDPALARRRRRINAELRRVRDAAGLPASDATPLLAQALRSMVSLVPEASDEELDAVLGECDARSYAPSGQEDDHSADDFQERALVFARAIAERTL